MIVDILVAVLLVAGLVVFVMGLTKLAFVPMAVVGEHTRRRRDESGAHTKLDDQPTVSVIIPAFNEERVLANCVRSVLRSDYPHLELVIVDDGSTDGTAALMHSLAADDPRVIALTQANAGKGAALNTGIARSSGEVLFFVDADGLFGRDTISEMLRGLHSEDVGAVCGDDRPINLDRVQTKMLTLNRAWRDLRYLWTVVLWPAYSVFMACVMVAALWQERHGEPAQWNKLERTGVVSIDGLLGSDETVEASPALVAS